MKNPETGQFKRFRVKVNRYGTPRERTEAARALMADISEKLTLGWNPLFEKRAPRSSATAFHVFDAYYRVKSKEMEVQSLHSYKSYINVFKEWMAGEGFGESRYNGHFRLVK